MQANKKNLSWTHRTNVPDNYDNSKSRRWRILDITFDKPPRLPSPQNSTCDLMQEASNGNLVKENCLHKMYVDSLPSSIEKAQHKCKVIHQNNY